ncbi:MAG: PDZ domain-containing protein [Wenzhouxiangella sp.]|nr:MAG: PDZ domain-containing protein [Wenzhouxiangella sp.]
MPVRIHRLLFVSLLALSAVLLATIFAGRAPVVQARSLAIDADDLIPVELASVGIVPFTGTPVVLLREPQSGSIVPIFIGPNEARAIVMAQRGVESPRPMTHDLLVNLLEALGGTLERVIVDELRDGTYLGALEISMPGSDEIKRIDTRPSDGLAMAVRTGAAILVAPDILEAGEDIPFEGLGDDDLVTAVGITVMPASRDLREALQLSDQPGVLVSSVSTMAALTGIQPGALIVAVNDRVPPTPLSFLELVSSTPAGEKVRIRYLHEGSEQEIELDTDTGATDEGRARGRTL